MSMIIRNKATGLKKTYVACDEKVYEKLHKSVLAHEMKHMREYTFDDPVESEEIYGLIRNVKVVSIKQVTGIPKLDCVNISPASATMLSMFQKSIGASFKGVIGVNDIQRFVMKPKWYRIVTNDGKVVKGKLADIIRPDMTIDVEYHMNFVRVNTIKKSGNVCEYVPSTDPMIRKIIINDDSYDNCKYEIHSIDSKIEHESIMNDGCE